jgi:hypothetical protein
MSWHFTFAWKIRFRNFHSKKVYILSQWQWFTRKHLRRWSSAIRQIFLKKLPVGRKKLLVAGFWSNWSNSLFELIWTSDASVSIKKVCSAAKLYPQYQYVWNVKIQECSHSSTSDLGRTVTGSYKNLAVINPKTPHMPIPLFRTQSDQLLCHRSCSVTLRPRGGADV